MGRRKSRKNKSNNESSQQPQQILVTSTPVLSGERSSQQPQPIASRSIPGPSGEPDKSPPTIAKNKSRKGLDEQKQGGVLRHSTASTQLLSYSKESNRDQQYSYPAGSSFHGVSRAWQRGPPQLEQQTLQSQFPEKQHQPQLINPQVYWHHTPEDVQQQLQSFYATQQPSGNTTVGSSQDLTSPQESSQQEVSGKKQPITSSEVSEPLDLIVPQRKKLNSAGTAGRRMEIETNHLLLKLGNLEYAVHYDVTIEPDKPKRLLRNVMENFRKINYPNFHPAFDGAKTLYSSTELPFGSYIHGEVTIQEGDRSKIFKVTINFATKVDLTVLKKYFEPTGKHGSAINVQQAIQCLDVVLRSASSLHLISAGRSFFTIPRNLINLGEGMQMYYGIYQSACVGWKSFLNVDVSHKAFPKSSSIIDIIRELCPRSNWDTPLCRRDFVVVDKFLRTLKVQYLIPNNPASRRVMGVNQLDQSAREARFQLDNGKEVTVEQYFRTIKHHPLKYPNMPCLWVGNKTRKTKILFPVELCTLIEGQVTNRTMTPKQTSAMIKQTATSTTERKKKIMEAILRANFNENKSAQEFGISVGEDFQKIAARVLEPPPLSYANNTTVRPHKGIWRPEKFIDGKSLSKWCIFCVADHIQPQHLQEFGNMMIQQGKPLGMQIENPMLKYCKVKQEFEQHFIELKEMQLILVVINDQQEIYKYVKQTAELVVGVLTQCVRERNIISPKPSTVKNILLKVNAKLNGVNHKLQPQRQCLDLEQLTMIMGADVTHPNPENKGREPSVAAVTASHDLSAFQYNVCWCLQKPGQEIIVDLASIVQKHIKFYESKNGVKPDRIIFFRDGVSEGEFLKVQNAEVNAIRQACTIIEKKYKPKITFLVVQKRHHTRFFPTNPNDSEDKNGNVPAGTVVDTVITHPTALDFYLVSHASVQGVARPTKYRVLYDENDLTENVLEQLTYHLCHMYTRCARSVSYPAPTYYAHLAAARAKVYCAGRSIDLDNLQKHQQELVIKSEIVADRPMYFV